MVIVNKVIPALAGLASIACAAPTSGKYSVKQVARPATKTTNFASQYARALTKFGATVPSNVQAAAVASGVATNTPSTDDEEYLTPVSVGGTTLQLDFDTGSSDLWVFSSELSASQRSGHSYYTPGSSASLMSGYTWDISYGDGSSASGNVYKDKVIVGGITVSSQAVEAAKKISSEFIEDTSDGLLGLGFDSINTVSPRAQKTWFSNAQSQLAKPLFGVALKHGEPGVFDFGFTDSSKYTGSLTYTDVDSSEGYWSFSVDGWSAGSASGQGFSGIADTGTTLLLLADDTVSSYYEQVDSASYSYSEGGYVFDCSADLPDFSVTIGDYTATVSGSLINYASIGGGSCIGGIQSNSGIGFSIFGDIFLKSQYVVFDASGPQLGFAPQA
ncbi:Penicillopepsin-1 [Penicillium longicatenatum]|uniref:Penicillopepsin-1 n=1 Tax=Penicillium longicatenatum TaxID=1561947 RepID=UPI00254813E4|nr:Penicillopepsin-1 [Penicillium longicatenatum]KAJ5639370.1 Penicillopepsin-1 [Penicillium longicatenatum]